MFMKNTVIYPEFQIISTNFSHVSLKYLWSTYDVGYSSKQNKRKKNCFHVAYSFVVIKNTIDPSKKQVKNMSNIR